MLLACAALCASLLLPAGAVATHHGEGVVDEVYMTLSYRASSLVGAPGQLVATLVLDDASPLAGAGVDFWREVEFLGTRRVQLGRTTTGADGSASLPLVQPEAALRVWARFAGGESYLAAEQAIEVSGSGVAPPPTEVPAEGGAASLAGVAGVVPPLLALTALAIWVLLIGLTVATVLAIRRGGRASAATPEERS